MTIWVSSSSAETQMVLWCSPHMHVKFPLDEQEGQSDWLETCGFCPIWWRKLESRVQDPALCQVELLQVLPASVPIRQEGETDTDQVAEEQDRAAQRDREREQLEGLVDDRARAEVTRPF